MSGERVVVLNTRCPLPFPAAPVRAEGVRVRVRVQTQVEGEPASYARLGRSSLRSSACRRRTLNAGGIYDANIIVAKGRTEGELGRLKTDGFVALRLRPHSRPLVLLPRFPWRPAD